MTAQKIVLVGAGSTVFAKNLLGDLLSYPALADATVMLYDIDQERLRTSEIVAHKIAQTLGANAYIETTLDRRQALANADFVISMFQVGGYKPSTVIDFEIPAKYGLRQTIGDTLGIGGIMRGLRTIPVLLDMLGEMVLECPNALHLNYVNPMVMNCWSMDVWCRQHGASIRNVGLCHSVQHTAGDLARDLGLPLEEIDYACAGINHMAFYLNFEHQGQNLYPRLKEIAGGGNIPYRGQQGRADGGVSGLSDAVRYKVFEMFGYFVTESSEHFSEYVPWFIKPGRDDLLNDFEIPLNEYITRCEHQLAGWESLRQELEDPQARIEVTRSDEYGATIVNSIVGGEPSVIYGNVSNQGLIDNLPQGCCVEVPCDVDSRGVTPRAVGALPPQLAGLMQTNLNVQGLTVEAVRTNSREHIYHAAMLDPLTAATLSVDEICAMVDDMLEAHKAYLPASAYPRTVA